VVARQVGPWQAKPNWCTEHKARNSVQEPASEFHQGHEAAASTEVRMYGRNPHLLTIID